jgi:hypothetical protein
VVEKAVEAELVAGKETMAPHSSVEKAVEAELVAGKETMALQFEVMENAVSSFLLLVSPEVGL